MYVINSEKKNFKMHFKERHHPDHESNIDYILETPMTSLQGTNGLVVLVSFFT